MNMNETRRDLEEVLVSDLCRSYGREESHVNVAGTNFVTYLPAPKHVPEHAPHFIPIYLHICTFRLS